ncbi:MAG: iron hydrogenase small subunit [Clostridia bacterium]|nr:iron hydrogenase small subunit [Clostridia bacterium]
MKKYICLSCQYRYFEEGKDSGGFVPALSTSQEDYEKNAKCNVCGQKIVQNGAKEDAELFLSAIRNPQIIVVAFTAPSIRTSLGEMFGMEPGSDVTGKMVSAIKALGVDYCFDMNFGADLTTLEESKEFFERIKTGENLPMLTSCCPAWVSFVEKAYPDFKKNLSTCKSPQQMFGAVLVNYFAKKLGVEPTRLFVTSIVPCLAKKLERVRPGENTSKVYDVDCTLTTVDLANILKLKKIDFCHLPDADFDNEFSLSSGAGTYFGNSGGVLQSILEENAEKQGKALTSGLSVGLANIKECKVNIDGKDVWVACASGLKNAKLLLENIKSGKNKYSLIEIMACEGGCVGGSGQPSSKGDSEIVGKRATALKKRADMQIYKTSDQNVAVSQLYETYFGGVGSKKAKALLHVKRQ